VSHFDGAGADIQRRAGKLLNAERCEPDAGADDVDDGVNRTDFMKMNFPDGHVVDSGFRFAELLKNRRRAVAYRSGKMGGTQKLEDGAQ
jgi:hypothetical protein